MKTLYHGRPPIPWNIGSARLWSGLLPGRPDSTNLHLAVWCRLGSLAEAEFALLDTGAEWSVIRGQTADLVRGDLEDLGLDVRFSTRHGRLHGRFHKLTVTLLADPEEGEDLSIEATVAVVQDWPGPVVLGYRGLLERVRFAVDPGDDPASFLFGVG